MNDERIGQMNGKWAMLFKVVLTLCAIVLPMLVALNVWFVTAIYDLKLKHVEALARIDAFIAQGPRYTPNMARADNAELRNNIVQQMREDHPPDWLTTQVQQNTASIEALQIKVQDGR